MVEVDVRRLEAFDYAELLHLASHQQQPHHGDHALPEEGGGGGALLARFMDALGPAGCGLLAVRGVPLLHTSREALLPLARLLALQSPHERSIILKDQGLGTDVPLKDPDRLVSSFAAQLNFGQEHANEHMQSSPSGDTANVLLAKGSDNNSTHCQGGSMQGENELHQLGSLFRQLGKAMVKVGLLVARVCDMAIQGAGLEEAILQSCTAKGRLIHYHSLVDRLVLRASSSCAGSKATKEKKAQELRKALLNTEVSSSKELWQQWHFDYGILTVLTVPMFLSAIPTYLDPLDIAVDHAMSHKLKSSVSVDTAKSDPSSGHIGLKVLNIGSGGVEFVSVPADCLVIQVGEAAQILTGGKLQATAHCVCRPAERNDISRETFVVFLQPAWHKRLISPKPDVKRAIPSYDSQRLENCISEGEFQEIQSKVPALESRWRDGCTFADFSRETTKQYYGVNGAQSQK